MWCLDFSYVLFTYAVFSKLFEQINDDNDNDDDDDDDDDDKCC